MKKTYTINLSGKIFHIDEDALEKLQEYINTLKTYYTREEDGNEIRMTSRTGSGSFSRKLERTVPRGYHSRRRGSGDCHDGYA